MGKRSNSKGARLIQASAFRTVKADCFNAMVLCSSLIIGFSAVAYAAEDLNVLHSQIGILEKDLLENFIHVKNNALLWSKTTMDANGNRFAA